MKREITPPSKVLLIIYRVLMAIILALALLLITGSLIALIRPPDSGPLFRIGGKPAAQGGGNSGAVSSSRAGEETAVFSGIGMLRIPVAGTAAAPSPATVILSVSFPYPANDRPFTEELASRIGEFRSIAVDYFSALPADGISRLNEETAKAEILGRYNALLHLGKIETLYFTDFMIVE